MGEKGWQEQDALEQGADDPLEALLLRGDQFQHEIRIALNRRTCTHCSITKQRQANLSTDRKTIASLAIKADKVDELDAAVEIQPQLLHNHVEIKAVLGGAVLEE